MTLLKVSTLTLLISLGLSPVALADSSANSALIETDNSDSGVRTGIQAADENTTCLANSVPDGQFPDRVKGSLTSSGSDTGSKDTAK